VLIYGSAMDRGRVLWAVCRDRQLRLLVGGLLGFSVSEAATWLAILIYANGRGGAAEAGLAAVSQLVPPGLVAPFTGYASDRFRRDRVLAVGSAFQAVAIAGTAVAMATDASALAVYGIGAIASAAMTVSRPTTWALFPWVCSRPEQLTAANVAASFAESVGLLLGPVATAALIAVSGPALVYAVMAGLMAVVAGTSLMVRIDRRKASDASISAGDVVRDILAGVRVVGSTGTGLVVAYLGLGFVLLGAVDVGAVLVADEVLGESESVAGLLGAAAGLGAVVGAAASVVLVGRARLIAPLLLGAAVAGFPIAATATTTATALALVLFAVNGVGAQTMETVGKTMIQRATADDVLARVFGLVESMTMLAMAVGAVAIAGMASWFGPQTALIVVGVATPLVAAVMARPLAAVDRATVPPDAVRIDALHRTSMFEPLALPVIEQLALNMTPLEVPAGTTLITAGDAADDLFLIEAGELEVRRNGRVVTTLGPGAQVGEVGLLRGQPRNATVSSPTGASVWAIDGEVFLEAVTGHPRSLATAEGITTAREN
jgi:MFS family permease